MRSKRRRQAATLHKNVASDIALQGLCLALRGECSGLPRRA